MGKTFEFLGSDNWADLRANSTQVPHLMTFFARITPQIAERILARSAGRAEDHRLNRTSIQKMVKKHALTIKRGRWRAIHQGIGFDDRGRLCDGEHRLRAIVLARTAVTMQVTFGLEPKDIAAIDKGRSRTLRDAYVIERQSIDLNPSAFATARFIVLGLERKDPDVIDDGSMHEFIDRHAEALRFATSVSRASYAPVCAVIVKAFYRHPQRREEILRFQRIVHNGPKSDADMMGAQAAIRLRDFLLSVRNSNPQALGKQRYWMTQTALTAYLEGRVLRTLRPSQVEQFHCDEIDADPLIASMSRAQTEAEAGRGRGRRSRAVRPEDIN